MRVYLDNAATTLQKPETVYEKMDYVNRKLAVNVGRGSYALAQEGVRIIEDTRTMLKKLIGAEEVAEVVFTASATLALNLIIGGMEWRKEDNVYISSFEHNAVIRTLYGYQRKAEFTMIELPLNERGEIDLKKTEYLFSQQPPTALFVNYVSNVTGYILPVEKLSSMAKEKGAVVVIDGAQALGAIPVSRKEIEADFLVFAGHKALHGPFGIGGFYNFNRRRLNHVIFGGTGSDSLNTEMPEGISGLEPGSANITAIAGLQAALEEISSEEHLAKDWEKERKIIQRLIEGLQKIRGVILYKAPDREHQAGVISINVQGYRAQELGRILDEDYGIAVRIGYHCAPLIHKHLQDEAYGGTVRISVDKYNTEEDIDEVLMAIEELAEEV